MVKLPNGEAARLVGAGAFRNLPPAVQAAVARMSAEDVEECGWGFFGAVHHAREEARIDKLLDRVQERLPADLRRRMRKRGIRKALRNYAAALMTD